MYNAKVKNYQKEALKTQVAGADRYELIQMLMGGTVDKLVMAKAAIERNNLEAKAEHISKASAIIDSLRGCLDFEVGGEVVQNLHALYSYMLDRLVDASLNNDVSIIEEVSGLIKEIKAGWDAIPENIRKQAVNAQADAYAG